MGDKPTLTVVPLRKSPPLNDIPARLRHLADRIENDTNNEFKGACIDTAVVMTRDDAGQLRVYGYGDNPPRREMIGMLFETATKFSMGAFGE